MLACLLEEILQGKGVQMGGAKNHTPFRGHCQQIFLKKLKSYLPGGGGGVMTLHDYGYLPPEFLKSYPVSYPGSESPRGGRPNMQRVGNEKEEW